MLWREFELARPRILGALLDATAHGLQVLPRVRLQRLPRMADFAFWATACGSAFRRAGTFEAAYSDNRREARGRGRGRHGNRILDGGLMAKPGIAQAGEPAPVPR